MDASSAPDTGARPAGAGVEIDPVCGMAVDPARAAGQADHGGRRYYFCCARCRERFVADPGRYLKPPAPSLIQIGRTRPTAATAPAAGVEYTCPMHPEVRQIGPGACPLCGMALEPKEITADEPANEELVDMTRRFRVS